LWFGLIDALSKNTHSGRKTVTAFAVPYDVGNRYPLLLSEMTIQAYAFVTQNNTRGAPASWPATRETSRSTAE
jgi:hypothetical protein